MPTPPGIREGRPAPPEIDPPATPTLERVRELRPQLDAIGDFLDWLHSEGYVLGGHQYHPTCRRHEYGDDDARCKCDLMKSECWGMLGEDCPHYDDHVDWLWAVPIRDRSERKETLVARYFGIDRQEMEREKERILDHVRQLQEGTDDN